MKPTTRLVQTRVDCDFVSEVVPTYDSAVFEITNFSELQSTVEVIYSAPLHANGLTWRLKVYPNGTAARTG